jgi:hypothetical protein
VARVTDKEHLKACDLRLDIKLAACEAGYEFEDTGFEFLQHKVFFVSPNRPGPHSLLFDAYEGFFPKGEATRA